MLLNSNFFQFSYQSNNFLIIKKLLQKIKNKKHIIKTTINYNSLKIIQKLLKKHLIQNSSKTTNIPKSPNIYKKINILYHNLNPILIFLIFYYIFKN